MPCQLYYYISSPSFSCRTNIFTCKWLCYLLSGNGLYSVVSSCFDSCKFAQLEMEGNIIKTFAFALLISVELFEDSSCERDEIRIEMPLVETKVVSETPVFLQTYDDVNHTFYY